MNDPSWQSDRATREQARKLRKNLTLGEATLWDAIRAKKRGFKVRRQHPIGDFIVDFYCPEQRLIIEIDGDAHLDQIDHDAQRTAILNDLGFRMIRFTNNEVENKLREVLQRIDATIASYK